MALRLTRPRGLCSHAVLGFSTTEAAMTASPLGNGLPSCLHSSCTTPHPSPGPAAAASTSPGSWSESAGGGGWGACPVPPELGRGGCPVPLELGRGGCPVPPEPGAEKHRPIPLGWTERSPSPSPCPTAPQKGEGPWGPRDGAGVGPWVWDRTETGRDTAQAALGAKSKPCSLFLILATGDRVFCLLFNVVLSKKNVKI